MREPKRRSRIIREDGPDPIDIHVGRRLREARKLAGYSQTDLADAIAVSFQAIQKYESGDNRLSASRLFAAAKALGVSVSFFFAEVEVDETRVSFSSKEIELIRALRLIPERRARDSIFAMIKQIGAARPDSGRDDKRKSA